MPSESQKAGPIRVANLFGEVRAALLELLRSLPPPDWERQTAAPRWTVKDVALHLLGGDVGNLSRRRDKFLRQPGRPIDRYSDFVAFINDLNNRWLQGARRLSPELLCDLLAFTGPQLARYFESLDLLAMGEPVSWAGPEAAPVWLDVAREYTEQWHHQQQIRDATARPALYSRRLFAPVLDTFMRGVPRVYAETSAREGTAIAIEISGESGGGWLLERTRQSWELLVASRAVPAASIKIDQDIAWRLFTKGVTADAAHNRSAVTGDAALTEPFFRTISVIG